MKKALKTILFCIINPHLIVLLIIGALLLALYKALYFISEKADDAARFIRNIDHRTGATRNYWTWCDFLVNDKQGKEEQ